MGVVVRQKDILKKKTNLRNMVIRKRTGNHQLTPLFISGYFYETLYIKTTGHLSKTT